MIPHVEMDIDLDRVVWDEDYRQAIKARLNATESVFTDTLDPPVIEQDDGPGSGDIDIDFTIAFQPIVDLREGTVFAHEALVRGVNGEEASYFFRLLHGPNRYIFDGLCRTKAIREAARLGMAGRLSVNVLPKVACSDQFGVSYSLRTARKFGLCPDRLIFELTETEKILNHASLEECISHWSRDGVQSAIDDFGAGYAGLSLLVHFQPDILKLDMVLTRRIADDPIRLAVIKGIIDACKALDIDIIAEGVETEEEMLTLGSLGIHLMQGHYFARPAIRSLPAPHIPPVLAG